MSHYSVSVIVPVFNEIELIETSLGQISFFMESHFSDYEIIIVESGSMDGSGEICDRLASCFPGIKVIHEGRRSGFGSALRLGYSRSEKDLLWLVVVDLPFPLETILVALPLLEKYDCIFSYRSKDNRDFVKKLRSYIYNLIAKTLLGLKVKHVNSAFRVLKRDVIRKLPLVSNNWTLDAEVLYEVTINKIPYTEIPVELRDRVTGRSSISVSDPFAMVKDLLEIRRVKGHRTNR